MVHCDATWPGADEECEQLALASLSAGGLYARLSNMASKAEDDPAKPAGTQEGAVNSRGHSMAPLVARAWTLSAGDAFSDPTMEARGYSPSSHSGPCLVELENDDLLDFCRAAIDEAKRSEPKIDLQLARILADARESSRRAAAEHGDPNSGPDNRSAGRNHFGDSLEPGKDYGIQLRKEQPNKKYFEERRTAKTRVPGKGRELQRGIVFEDPVFSQPDDFDIEPPPKPKPKPKVAETAGPGGRTPAMADPPAPPMKSFAARGLTPWKVVCSPHVAIRAKPKATAKLVGQIYTGETVYVKEDECAGAWLRVYEAPGHELPSDAWVLSDATEFGTGVLLKRVDGSVRT